TRARGSATACPTRLRTLDLSLELGADGELRSLALRDVQWLAGTGVLAGARLAKRGLERPETGQRDLVAGSNGVLHCIDERVQRVLGVGLAQVRFARDRVDELALVHGNYLHTQCAF